MSLDHRIERLGDQALLLRLGDGIDLSCNRRVHALAERLAANAPDWLTDLVPAYASLAVIVDPDRIDDPRPLELAERWLRATLTSHDPREAGGSDLTGTAVETMAALEIPVRYGGEFGPDLAEVAQETGLSIEEVVARHVGAEYTVAMLGFAPGFPYLLGLDPALAVPRLATPRTRVPAGSVGLGGAQTGIYPRASPGGWRLIGRTPLTLFDPEQDPPSRLRPGQRVRFTAIANGPHECAHPRSDRGERS